MRKFGELKWLCVTVAWAAVVTGTGALLTASHQRPLIASAGATTPASTTWTVTHVLTANCPCSAAVAAHLERQGKFSQAGVQESVVLIAEDGHDRFDVRAKLVASGFVVTVMNSQHAWATWHVNGGPMLLVDAPSGNRAYSGGYTDTRPTSELDDATYRDRQILSACQNGQPTPTLPALGCTAGTSPEEVLRDLTTR